MSRHIWLYIVYGSPLVLFFVLLTTLNYVAEFSLLLSFAIATIFAIGEFIALRFIFSRIFPQS